MNDLSWFLYFADTIPRVSVFAVFITIVFGITTIFYSIASWFAKSGDKEAQDFIEVPVFRHSILVFVVASAISLLTPSKEAMYLIAGSEAGEFVVNTPEAKAILSDIQEVIQLQIQELKPDDSKRTN